MLNSSRLLFGGIVLCVVLVASSLFWAHHVQQEIKAREAASERILKRIKQPPAVEHTAPPASELDTQVEMPPTSSHLPNQDVQAAPERSTEEFFEMLDNFNDTPLPVEETPDGEVTVSPFGFGPYPAVPAGYDLEPIWMLPGAQNGEYPEKLHRECELMERVLIKLWNQGERGINGISFQDNGKVYPNYPNTVYIEIEEDNDWWYPQRIKDFFDGKTETFNVNSQAIRVFGGDGSLNDRVLAGERPPGVRYLSLEDGIEPYEFLELTK